jgi:O-antigen/teichoic acid export membrane protein
VSRLPRRFRRNLVTSYLNTATLAVITLVMTPVLVDGLGRDGYGIWALVGSFALYLELLEFGFGKAASKYVAQYAALGEESRVRSAVVTSFWLLAIPGVGALVLGAGIALVFPSLFGVPADLEGAAQLLVLIIVFDLAVSIPSDTFGSALIGLQRFDLINASLIVVSIAQAAAWAIVLGSGGGLVALGVVTVAISLVGQLSRYLLARRQIRGLAMSPRNIERSLIRAFAGLSLWFAVIDIALILLVRLDVLVVGLVVGIEGAAVYAVGQKLVIAVDQLIAPATKMFFPHSSALEARRDLRGLRASMVSGTRMALAVAAPLCLSLGLFAEPILDAWVGDGFEEGALVVVFLAAALVLTTLTRTGLLMLQGAGRARRPALIVGGEAALNVALSVALARTMGVEGVALATLIAAALTNLVVLLPYICREFDLRVGALLAPLARAHAMPAGVAVALALLVDRLDPSGVLVVAAAAVTVAAVYAGLLLLTGVTPSERRELAAQLRGWRTRTVTPPA